MDRTWKICYIIAETGMKGYVATCRLHSHLWEFNRAVTRSVFIFYFSQTAGKNQKLPHQPLNIALLTNHTSASVNRLSMCVCEVLILNFLLASDGYHSSTEVCITNSPKAHSAAYSHTSSFLSLDNELRQWIQWSRRIKTAGVVVTFYDCWQAESIHLLRSSTWQRHRWLIWLLNNVLHCQALLSLKDKSTNATVRYHQYVMLNAFHVALWWSVVTCLHYFS